MQLKLESYTVKEVVVVRCRGRIVTGEEARFLQSELDTLTGLSKRVVLELAEVTYLDSGGLGTVVRILGRLRARRGDLKICQVPPFIREVLKVTNLLGVLHPYASEREALEAFSDRSPTVSETFQASKNNRIVCLDTSLDLLAYLRVLLKSSGCEVFTTQYPSDAMTLAKGAPLSIVICGPGIYSKASAVEKLRESAPNAKVLGLPPDFSTSDADRAGPALVKQVRSLLGLDNHS